MSPIHLTGGRIDACQPRKKTYIVRDKKVKGLCLAVNPGGSKSFFVQTTCKGRELRETICDAASTDIDEARDIANDKIAAFRRAAAARSALGPNTPLSVIAEIAFERRTRLWKPGTMAVNKCNLNLILPTFGDRPVGGITHRDVEEWHQGLQYKPGSANRAATLLSIIMVEAEELGCRPEDSNPAKGLRRYKCRERNRLPTVEEIGRLGKALREAEHNRPRQTAIIRLLILTGCRKSEILNLRWKDYRDGNLHLVDSKSGPKTVFLSTPARKVLENIKTRRGKWVFPMKSGLKPQYMPEEFWKRIKIQAGLDWMRIHDLRHTYASLAIRSGVSLRMVGKLLGHGKAQTTMRYAHLDDATMRDAASKATAGMTDNGRAAQ